MKLKDLIESNNTGLDAIKRAPIVEYDTGIRCLRIGDISNNRPFNDWGYTVVEEKNYNKFQLKKGDIIVARTGATIGVNKYIDKDYKSVYNNGLIRIRVKEENNPRYVYYLLQSNNYKNFIKTISMGTSTQPNMQMNDLLNLDVPNFDRFKQDKIVELLGSIDKKIELNNEINNNLYEIALNILNNYFDNNEEKESYKEIIKFIKGKKPENVVDKYQDGYEKYLTIACLNGEENNYANPNKMIITNRDILMVMDGASSGDVYFSSYGIVGSTLSKVKIINQKYIPEYVFFTFKKYKNNIQCQTTGSAIPHTNKDIVLNLEIPKIEIQDQMRFKSLLDEIQHNNEENAKLSQLRDALLPKVMNGEVELDNIEF